ncbi:MAG: Crp/Fnr family transcriptional regulator [Anaerolineales bacterium]|nr:Crp/Fnr family transcriptional regulator [Anaerolineales bacterium]
MDKGYQNLIERMKNIPHFKNLEIREIANIIQAGRIRHVEKDTVLLHEGDPCGGLFVLLKGEITLQKVGPEGHNYIMAVLEPVTMFNEVAVLDRGNNPARAVALTTCRIWQTDCESFHRLLTTYPQIALGLLPIIAARNRLLVEQYEDLSFLSVRARTAKLLLELSRNGEEDIQRDHHPIQMLSARISTAPEVISRAMRSIKQQGCIDYNRQWIRINKPEELARIAHLGVEF